MKHLERQITFKKEYIFVIKIILHSKLPLVGYVAITNSVTDISGIFSFSVL